MTNVEQTVQNPFHIKHVENEDVNCACDKCIPFVYRTMENAYAGEWDNMPEITIRM